LGSGNSKPTTLEGEPFPSMAWHVEHVSRKMSSPVAFAGRPVLASDVGGVVAS
jgi:hypothetical protein